MEEPRVEFNLKKGQKIWIEVEAIDDCSLIGTPVLELVFSPQKEKELADFNIHITSLIINEDYFNKSNALAEDLKELLIEKGYL